MEEWRNGEEGRASLTTRQISSQRPEAAEAESGGGNIWEVHPQESHHLVPPREHISRKLELKARMTLRPRNADPGCGHPNQWLHCQSTAATKVSLDTCAYRRP